MLFKNILLFSLFMVMSLVQAAGTEKKTEDTYDPVHEIMHHVQDSHSWHIWGEGERAIVIFLPVIIWDKGFHVFSSSEFGQDEQRTAKTKAGYYRLYHNKIYKTNSSGDLNFRDGIPLNERPFDISITKVVLQMILVMFILLFLGIASARVYKKSTVPRGIARFTEPILVFVRDEIALQNIGTLRYRRFVPYLCSLFFFVLVTNLLGLIPNSANISGNIAFTLVLALFTFFIVTFNGKKAYWSHIFDPLGESMSFSQKFLIYVILIPVEILGMFTKPFALMIRLFANITAGHIVILSLVSLVFIMKSYAIAPVSILLTLFINILELLVALLQAYIFTLLTALFIGMAVEEGHHSH